MPRDRKPLKYSTRHRSRIIKARVEQSLQRFTVIKNEVSNLMEDNSDSSGHEINCEEYDEQINLIKGSHNETVITPYNEVAPQPIKYYAELNDETGATTRSIEHDVTDPCKLTEEVINLKDVQSVRHSLAKWATENRISKLSVNKLLSILKKIDLPGHDLPTDYRSLLGTPRCIDAEKVFPGEYLHFGLEAGIFHTIKKTSQSVIEVLVNIDGLPLASSSNSQFWPILGMITSIERSKPFVIGMYHGKSKPENCNSFLKRFVEEIQSLNRKGLNNGDDKSVPVKISGFICDTPARAFICQTKGHSGYFGCDKCLIKGEYLGGRVCFPSFDADPRSDENFRAKVQAGHHVGYTILEELPNFKMVSAFPLDYMHLVCLGVMRKLLKLWIKGKDSTFKLRPDQVTEVSLMLLSLTGSTSAEFVRKPRSLTELSFWKATEFRQFLLYSGPLALKNVLPKRYFENFLCLHVAIRILASPKLSLNMRGFAEELLRYFVKSFGILYGTHLISYNVHGLIHLANDVKTYGPLDNFSAFEFENYPQTIKRKISNSRLPLKQIINRIYEERNIQKYSVSNNISHKNMPVFKMIHNDGPLLPGCGNPQHKKVEWNGFYLGVKESDNCCVMKDKSYVVVENIATAESGGSVVIGRKFLKLEDLYSKPCQSSIVGVVKASRLSDNLSMWKLSHILGKVQKYRINACNKWLLVELLHKMSST